MPRYYPARGWLTQYIIMYRHSARAKTGLAPHQLVGYLGCELRTAATPKPTRYRALDYSPRFALYSAGFCGPRGTVFTVIPQNFVQMLQTPSCYYEKRFSKMIFFATIEVRNRVGFSVSKNSPYFLNVAKFWWQSGQHSGVCARITSIPPLGAGLP